MYSRIKNARNIPNEYANKLAKNSNKLLPPVISDTKPMIIENVSILHPSFTYYI